MSLTSRIVELGECTMVEVSGELDLSTTDELWETLSEALSTRDQPLVLDLGELTFCDSAGLAVLVRAHNALEASGQRLVVARPAPIVTRILDLSGLSQAIDTTTTVDEACEIVANAAESPAQ